jgi:hypothetical protein
VRLSHAELDAFYAAHVRVDYGDDGGGFKLWSCGLCSQRGHSRRDVQRHLDSHHIATDPYECEQCGSAFGTRRGLTRHRLSVHRSAAAAALTATYCGAAQY